MQIQSKFQLRDNNNWCLLYSIMWTNPSEHQQKTNIISNTLQMHSKFQQFVGNGSGKHWRQELHLNSRPSSTHFPTSPPIQLRHRHPTIARPTSSSRYHWRVRLLRIGLRRRRFIHRRWLIRHQDFDAQRISPNAARILPTMIPEPRPYNMP